MLRPRALAITTITLLSVLLPLDAWAVPPRKDAGYQGSSSQKLGNLTQPVSLRVSKSGASVTRIDIPWTTKCTAPDGRHAFDALAVIKNRPISPTGSFGSAASYPGKLSGGQTAIYTVKLTGTFTKRTLVRGTLRVTIAIKDATGQQVDSCDSGAVTWQARD